MALAMLGPPSGRKSSANAHTVKPKIKSPSRQRCKVRPVPSEARIAKYKFSVPGPSEARAIKHKHLLFYSSCFGMRKPSDTFRLAAPEHSGGDERAAPCGKRKHSMRREGNRIYTKL